MTYGSISVDQINNTTGYSLGAGNASLMKNRIINGAMVIDQRNAGTSINTDNGVIFTVDRFFFLEDAATTATTQQVSDAPAGFSYSFKFTNSSTTATPSYAQLVQRIEGYNVADLSFGTSNAKTVTLSFWVKSSLTGQFSASLRNSDSNRSNVSTYTINSANTWEYKTITFVGDTSGTWLKTNGNGLEVIYRIAGSGGTSSLNQWTATGDAFASGTVNVMGTSSATWQITGVQLEVGSVATGYEYRDFGKELQMCQRYYETSYAIGTAVGADLAPASFRGVCNATYASSNYFGSVVFKVYKRGEPTVTFYTSTTAGSLAGYTTGGASTVTATAQNASQFGCSGVISSVTNLQFVQGNWTASAEL